MKDVLLQHAIKLNKRHKRRIWQKRLVQSMAALVVFCTVYVLILPAVTLSADPVCGLPEHSHSESCYDAAGALSCGLQLHGHTDACYTAQETTAQLRYHCGYGAHTHSDVCYDESGSLKCTIPEHAHSAECGEEVIVLDGNASDIQDEPIILYADTVADTTYHVWLDGTLGGLAAFEGSPDTYYAVAGGSNMVLPEAWDSPTVYNYILKGWYDITSRTYYQPGDTVTITQDTVFYADWIAASYDIGVNNSNVVNCVDTSEFITMQMFDYNALFNTLSFAQTGTITASTHTEYWDEFTDGLNFVFRDQDSKSAQKLSRPGDQTAWNYVTAGLVSTTDDAIMQALFGDGNVIGRQFLGGGNYLFQYMDDADSDYYGYYYYDSAKNAASYNQSDGRFYVYDYLERTTDSGSGGTDFLPLNSPYMGITITPEDNGTYVYNATKSGGQNMYSNYFFGMRVDIDFFLSNETGQTDSYGNYGNLDIHGNPMKFSFSGDDDLWVFIDGELVLDVGGLHAALSGTIDFSTGVVSVDGMSDEELVLKAGSHTMSIYYLERGASQSNCAIYFNLEPRYGLELEKQDYQTGESIDGVVFSVYSDADCTNEVKLWNSYDEAKVDGTETSHFTTKNGSLSMWGLVPAKVYYLKEDKELTPQSVQEKYQLGDDVIRVTLNDHGTDVGELTILRGGDERDEGFEVVGYSLNEITQTVRIAVTNPKVTDVQTQKVKVFKTWAAGATDIPDSITLYLTANGERVGSGVELTAANGWVYTWSLLPMEDENGPITYGVEELQMPGYHANVAQRVSQSVSVDWLEVKVLEDGASYLLIVGGNALALNGSQLTTMTLENAKEDLTALWSVEAYGDGFRIYQDDYSLVLSEDSCFTVSNSGGNQTLYFDGNGIFGMYKSQQYYLGTVSGGTAGADTEPKTTQLMKQEQTPQDVLQFVMENTPITEENTTKLTVTKQWQTSHDVSDLQVTIRLYADGKDTGRTLVLNAANNWTGTFEGLYNALTYTVAEDTISGYEADYSEITANIWTETSWQSSTSLTAGEIYCFIYNGNAITDNGSAVVMSAVDTADIAANQQWEAVSYNGNILLKNVSTGNYLRISSSSVLLTNSQSEAGAASLSNNRLRIGSRYIRISSSGSITGNNSGTSLTTYWQTTTTVEDGLIVTVTNAYLGVPLPETGGAGVSGYYLAGMILAGIALWLYLQEKRKFSLNNKEAQL